MLNLQTVHQFMLENFEQVTVSKNNTHWHARCRFCGDSKKSKSKKRFHLDWKHGKPEWQCFNCDESGRNFIVLYAKTKGISYDAAKRKLYSFDPTRLKNTLKSAAPVITPKKPSNVSYNSILDDCIGPGKKVDSMLYPNWEKILSDFTTDRKIPPEYRIYYAFQGRYKGRLIIPIFNKYDDIVYFQARRLPKSGIEPKYKNPPTPKSLIIHNEEKFRNDLYIIVAEGLIDGYTVGAQGTTCLGKSISNEFLHEVFKRTNVGVIVAFDSDADGQESMQKFMDENEFRKRVRYFLMPKEYKKCKDINKVSVVYNINDMYQFVVENSYSHLETVFKLKLGG